VNPLTTIAKNGLFGENTFITDAWSAKTISVIKRNFDLIGQSSGNRTERTVNAALCLAGSSTVSCCNSVKGAIGLVYSSVKAVLHALSFASLLTVGILALFMLRTDLLNEAVKHLKFLIIDVLSMVACAGYMTPNWVPIVLTFLLAPHIAIPAVLLIYSGAKLLANFTGVADLVAYAPTTGLLLDKYYRATHPDALDAITDHKEKTKCIEDGKELLSELNPVKSLGGAIACSLMVHVFSALAITLLDQFVPGIGSIASKAIEYGPPAAMFVGSTIISKCRETSTKNLQPAVLYPS
jgi:hypothetical protein